MTFSVTLTADDLTPEGIFEAASVLLQGRDLGQRDWSLTGAVIEQMGISLSFQSGSAPTFANEINAILYSGARDGRYAPTDRWEASVSHPTDQNETASDPHLAVAKLVVATGLCGESLKMSADQMLRWVAERHMMLDAVIEGSAHHTAVASPADFYTLRAGDKKDDLEHFQNVIAIVDALDGALIGQLSKRHYHAQPGEPYEASFQLL